MPDALYHYCSTEVFHKIVTRGFRLSSMRLSNDLMEGKMLARALRTLAEADGFEEEQVQKVLGLVRVYEQLSDCLALCLSEESDLLSQWRGYADDGHGVAIGFSVDYLTALVRNEKPTDSQLYLGSVKYLDQEHLDIVRPLFKALKFEFHLAGGGPVGAAIAALSGGEGAWVDRFNERHALMESTLFLLKANAFHEEKEWRLYTTLITEGDSTIEHHPRRNCLVPFASVPLVAEKNPIFSVCLGPKHQTPPLVVSEFLFSHGHANVSIRTSAASYR